MGVAAALVAGGAIFAVKSLESGGIEIVSSTLPNGDPKHPVTDPMRELSEAQKANVAPEFQLRDALGETHTLASLTREKPLFLYFILDGCPCSVDGEPLFKALEQQFHGRIQFAAMIDGDAAVAANWIEIFRNTYPILCDPSKETIRAFEATNSAFSVLVGKDGKIRKMWPGYSIELLQEMNRTLAEEIGEAPKSFDTLSAPAKETSGCLF